MTEAEALLEPGSPEHLHYIKVKNRYRFFRGLYIALRGLLIAFVVVVLLYNSITVKKSTQILIDCTTPHHACYEQGRSATSGAVGTINKVTIAATVCANNLPRPITQASMEACVKKAIE